MIVNELSLVQSNTQWPNKKAKWIAWIDDILKIYQANFQKLEIAVQTEQ